MLAASLNKVLAGARVELGLYGLATLVIFRTSSLPVRSQTYSKCSSGISGSATAVGRKTHTFVPPDCRRRSEEQTSELQSLMRISYAVFCLTKKKQNNKHYKPQ